MCPQSTGKKPVDMVVATHFCKGNFKGNPLFSGFYDAVAPVIADIPYDAFFVSMTMRAQVLLNLGKC